MIRIYHITSAHEADAALKTGVYEPAAFGREGFIHCSYSAQVIPVANRLFRGKSALVVMEIDPAALDCDVVDENLEGGLELFPHVYGRLKMSAVIDIHDFPCDSDGGFSLPETLSARRRSHLPVAKHLFLMLGVVLATTITHARASAQIAVSGASGGTDTISLVDMNASPPRTIDQLAVGPIPEGVAISPNGRFVAVTVMNGSNASPTSPFFNDLALLKVIEIRGKKLGFITETKIGRWCQGAGWTPKSNTVLAQCNVWLKEKFRHSPSMEGR